jgi:hypothetical protein
LGQAAAYCSAPGLEWFGPNCDAPNRYLHWHVTEPGYGYCPSATLELGSAAALNAPSCLGVLAMDMRELDDAGG